MGKCRRFEGLIIISAGRGLRVEGPQRPSRTLRGARKSGLVLGPTFSLLGTTREEETYGTNHRSRPSQPQLRGHADVAARFRDPKPASSKSPPASATLFPRLDLTVGRRPGWQPNCRITREPVRSRVLCVAFCHRCSSCKAVTHSFDSMKRDSIRPGCKLIVK